MPQVRLNVDGAPDAGVALWDWLRADPGLRGLVSCEQVISSEAGAMGGATELVVALVSTGTLAAVARTVGVWLTHRHADVSVTVTLPNGETVALDAQRVRAGDVERLLQAAGASTVGSPGTPPDSITGVPPSGEF